MQTTYMVETRPIGLVFCGNRQALPGLAIGFIIDKCHFSGISPVSKHFENIFCKILFSLSVFIISFAILSIPTDLLFLSFIIAFSILFKVILVFRLSLCEI